MAGSVRGDQLDDATPCAEWSVRDLLDHMVGGTDYLLTALDCEPLSGADRTAYAARVVQCVAALNHDRDALAQRCISPAGFEWSVAEATAGTFMDQLVHTWDLATAIGADTTMDPELVEACVAMFLPDMPEIERKAGLIGPAVPVADDASPQFRLLAAMGRTP